LHYHLTFCMHVIMGVNPPHAQGKCLDSFDYFFPQPFILPPLVFLCCAGDLWTPPFLLVITIMPLTRAGYLKMVGPKYSMAGHYSTSLAKNIRSLPDVSLRKEGGCPANNVLKLMKEGQCLSCLKLPGFKPNPAIFGEGWSIPTTSSWGEEDCQHVATCLFNVVGKVMHQGLMRDDEWEGAMLWEVNPSYLALQGVLGVGLEDWSRELRPFVQVGDTTVVTLIPKRDRNPTTPNPSKVVMCLPYGLEGVTATSGVSLKIKRNKDGYLRVFLGWVPAQTPSGEASTSTHVPTPSKKKVFLVGMHVLINGLAHGPMPKPLKVVTTKSTVVEGEEKAVQVVTTIPYEVNHTCGHKWCLGWWHMRWDTHKVNAKDYHLSQSQQGGQQDEVAVVGWKP
jgi:hypothetical protein